MGRKAIFTFEHDKSVEIGAEEIGQLGSILNVDSVDGILPLCPKGNREEGTEESYKLLDKLLLPHLEIVVFFENFSDPQLLFVDPDNLNIVASGTDSNFKGARITYFALLESDSGEENRVLEVGVESKVELEVVDGVDIENAGPWDGSDVGEQIQECGNMFNFLFTAFEFEDDEGLEHYWSAKF